MRARFDLWVIGVAAAALLLGTGAAGDDLPAPDAAEIQDALEEPLDPDEAANLAADEDPEDVGQKALEPAEAVSDSEAGADLPKDDLERP